MLTTTVTAAHGNDPPPTGQRPARGVAIPTTGKGAAVNATVLWLIAAVLVIVGIVQLLQGQIILGIVLIVVGLLVGPGGYSVFDRRR